jgi:L-2-hydroxycarboxylate dehydrogenase (NAD+)
VANFERFAAATLVDFTRSVLLRMGMPAEDASITAEMLIDADLMGIDSHGIAHLATHRGYVPGFRGGTVNPTPSIRPLRETASTACLDGDRGYGLLVGYRAMCLAIEKARACGTGVVTVTNSRHFGAAGYYARMAVPENMIGMAMTNASPWVVPTFGRKRMIGTNPIAFAAPAGREQPFLCDLATSAVAMGKLEIAEREGKPIPEGWALDEQGQGSVDIPRVRAGGGLLPLGSTPIASSFKGYALGLMVDVLCGVLSGVGSSMQLERGTSQSGHFFMAMRIDGFRDVDDFKAMMDDLQRTFRTAETVAGAERVLLPGQREYETRAERARHGIPLHASVTADLDALAAELELPPPARL